MMEVRNQQTVTLTTADSLLRIVSRIREYPREDAPDDAIPTCHQYPMLVCFHELLVEEEQPYALHKLALAKCEHISRRCGAVFRLVVVLHVVGELGTGSKHMRSCNHDGNLTAGMYAKCPPRLANATKKTKRSNAVQPPVSSASIRTKGKERARPEGSSGEEQDVAPVLRATGKHLRDIPASEQGSEDEEDAPEPVSKRFRPLPTVHFDAEVIREYELVLQCPKYVPAICYTLSR